MSAAAALLLAAAAVLSWPARRRPGSTRLRQLSSGIPVIAEPVPGGRIVRSPVGDLGAVRVHLVAGLTLVAAVVVLGPLAGGPLGAGVAVAVEVVLPRLKTDRERRQRAERLSALPLLLDLAAVSLRAGLAPGPALSLAAEAVGGPLADELAAVAALSMLGASPADAWREVTADRVLGVVGRAVIRAGDSGSALASGFERVAAELRAGQSGAALSRAHRVSVISMLPLGLCFLPAFVCIGVVPVVVGVLSRALH